MDKDLLVIANSLLEHFNTELGRSVKGFTKAASEKLCAHTWPGNVRELRNVLERAIIFSKNEIMEADGLNISSPAAFVDWGDASGLFRYESGGTLEDLERQYIRHILETSDSSYAEVARILGISKKTLWEKRKRYSLDEEAEKLEEVAE